MTGTRVSVLTPAGTGAVATVAVAGERAWEFARRLFRPAGKPLPDAPELHRFWFGRIGEGAGDEVILAVTAATPEAAVEVHCHGGRRVVRWVVEQFVALGCEETPASGGCQPPVEPRDDENRGLTPPARLLPFAPTLRTASVLLDQLHGAFDTAVRRLLDAPDPAALAELARLAPVGRHLIEPWKVVVAGPPNVGKSSLVNALAGYQRAVVSPTAGTTRDVVTARVAFDGWPVELTDTAGLRDAEGLEAAGVDRARRVLAEADLVLWVMDASDPAPVFPDEETLGAVKVPRSTGWVLVMNKADQSCGWPPNTPPGAIHLSALTGENLRQLVDWISYRLVPHAPPPGAAVPYTPALADRVEAAHAALAAGHPDEAARLLRECVS